MAILPELGKLAAEKVIEYSPQAEKGAVGFIKGNMGGIRRVLTQLEPKIPRYLDSASKIIADQNDAFGKQIKNMISTTGIKPGDPRLLKVIDVLEGKKPSTTLDPHETQVYSWARLTYDKYSKALGMEPGDKINKYFTHIVSPANWRMIEESVTGNIPIGRLQEADQARAKSIIKIAMKEKLPLADSFEMYRKSTTQFADVLRQPGIPTSVKNAFLEARQGFPVYSKDFYQVLNTYGQVAHRRLHLEPALRQVGLLAQKLPQTVKDQLETRIRHGYLHQPTKSDSMIRASFAPFDTFLRTISGGKLHLKGDKAIRSLYDTLALWDIGFSPSPIKKHFVADMMSIYAELGEKWTGLGLAKVADPNLRNLAHTLGNVRERNTPLDIFEEYAPRTDRILGKAWHGTQKAAFYAYSKVDLMNQYTAWIGGYMKARKMGMRLQPIQDMVLKHNMSLPDAVIEYANRVNNYTVPRNTPLDIPGMFTGEAGPLMRLALQFSSKKMARAELIWDQAKRATRGEFGPIGRTLLGTLMLTGLPFDWDEKIHQKTGLDPNRIPMYNFLGKHGLGLKDTLWNLLPSFGPAISTPLSTGKVVQSPAVYRKATTVYNEMKTGKSRSATGEYAYPITPGQSMAKAFGFDKAGGASATVEQLRTHIKEYRDLHISASKELSLAYYDKVTMNHDWAGFYQEMSKIQKRYPDVPIDSAMLHSAVQRVEISRQERMEKREPKPLRLKEMLHGG